MDEEGASAIATLNEIGINEIRLRDTLLRATNATELFAGTQALANAAWEENAALTEEAGKRYATTESRLVNLKNKAVLFGQQIGDDLNPMIQSLIDGTGELLDKFLEMDEAQRMQVIRYAAMRHRSGQCCCSWARSPRAWVRCPRASASLPRRWARRAAAGRGLSLSWGNPQQCGWRSPRRWWRVQ